MVLRQPVELARLVRIWQQAASEYFSRIAIELKINTSPITNVATNNPVSD